MAAFDVGSANFAGVSDDTVAMETVAFDIDALTTNHPSNTPCRLPGGAGDTDDDGDDQFDVIDAPITVLCVAVNQTGTRIAVGHTRGFFVYGLLFGADAAGSNSNSPGPVGGSTGGRSSANARDTPLSAAASPSSVPKLVEVICFDPARGGGGGGGSTGSGCGGSFHRNSPCGVGIVALLFDSYTVAVVGGGASPLDAAHRLWLFYGNHDVRRVTFPDAVRRVALGSGHIVALTQSRLVVTSLSGEKLFDALASGGAAGAPAMPLAVSLTNALCAFPDAKQGNISLVHYERRLVDSTPFRIDAHSNALAALCLNTDGSVVASASERGTLIRVFRTHDGTRVTEVRNAATAGPGIRHLALSPSEHIFALCGQTVKIFYVGSDDDARAGGPTQSPQPQMLSNGGSSQQSQRIQNLSPQLPAQSNSMNGMPMAPAVGGASPATPAGTAALIAPAAAPSAAARRNDFPASARNQSSVFASLSFLSPYFKSQFACCETAVPPSMVPTFVTPEAPVGGGGPSSSAASAASILTSLSVGSFASFANVFGGGGGGTTAPAAAAAGPPSLALPDSADKSLKFSDAVLFWWETPGVVEAARLTGGGPKPPPTGPNRHRLYMYTMEHVLATFLFDSVLGTVTLAGSGLGGGK